MATAAYAAGLNTIGNQYAKASELPLYAQITPLEFENLQGPYRRWTADGEFLQAFTTAAGEKMTGVFNRNGTLKCTFAADGEVFLIGEISSENITRAENAAQTGF